MGTRRLQLSRLRLPGLLVLFLGLTVADVLTTNAVISSGIGQEGNPVVRVLMSTLGWWWWIPKMVFGVILALLCNKRWDKSHIARLATLAFSVVYLHVVSHNFAIIRAAEEIRRFCG